MKHESHNIKHMEHAFKKLVVTFLTLSLALGGFLFASTAWAAPELIKANGFDTIYYLDSAGVRHAFPNITTYQTWYGKNFSQVVNLSAGSLAQYPLGENITARPGVKLVKVPSAPQVYAVEQGGVLREIQNASIAEAIYGENWASRVIDVPEVFFSDYVLGQPIKHDYTVPDSTLYQDQNDKKYYYLNHGILREFASTQAVLANRLDLSDAITGSKGYYLRERPITGLDKGVFNPVAPSLTDRRDCANTGLKAAVIFLAESSYTPAEVEKVQTIKNAAGPYFNWVTKELSSLDLNYPTAIMLDDGYLLKDRPDNTIEMRNEVLNSFYDNNSDIFDFIFIFTNFNIPAEDPSRVAYFLSVTNKQEGVGKAILDRSNIYGSTGKLKGIIVMGNVDQYTPGTPEGLNRAMDIVAHEVLHQWAAYITFDDNGVASSELLRSDEAHWNIYDGFISPLGGSGWINNGDGTYTSGLLSIDSTKRQYTDLDLYLMGLLPKLVIDPVSVLVPKNPKEIGNTIAATPKFITIDQIIKTSGKYQCSLD